MRYLATPIGATDEVVMPYFILVFAFLLDPAAVLLLLAAFRASHFCFCTSGAWRNKQTKLLIG
jgi:hypothetical protein